ncbi:MAG: tRNA (adenosine(37)-N6)-threonylcarbamoyltransferase complex dimerization subunit type 1 TsaB [Elusimicrobia bacterium]|nr:tRNA (adenosine(37)-N6)-threonylcarbamoyltransferase complex dimerization subunit type 1 TsaB [Elusimicrobiota bacterium]MDE2236767.1 tRNA (adenosine(37)-N6)-threonylcarbamoyltransferase complex dimerization subunit type 1 TsaB [Elusimicrobiota bacterium]MDE2425092.1 tRNA (adenosine(37)-N6)-threonylcarbamoyltransferase complex dimerization subunit type 1 TsaB [Elusimicrobiota bacterium]
MGNILAVDTTGEAFSAALQAGRRVVSVHRVYARPHDETLLPAVDRLLRRAGLSMEELDAIAAASGPGRFTGIRIGMAYAAVAALCLGKPALAVTRFEALAFDRKEERFCVVLEAFRGEKYYQFFKKGRPEGPPVWARELPRLDVPVVTGEPTAARLLGPAQRQLATRPRAFQPLYLKPAGYERPARPVR